jgi:hypothetical protein
VSIPADSAKHGVCVASVWPSWVQYAS